MKMILRVNTGNVRHSPHDGQVTTIMRFVVTLTDKPPVVHNGRNLVTVLDSFGREHLVDEWFLSEKFSPFSVGDIKAAVESGQKVHWKHEGYQVLKDSIGQWHIKCLQNENCIGLTHQDGETLNGEIDEFYAVP